MTKEYGVLVGDDSMFTHTMVGRCLANTEFKVLGGGRNGEEAVEKFKALSPDVVLLDVIMPGQGGVEALKAILAHKSDAKVVMLSSLGTEETVTECLTAGAKTFIQKPFERDALLKCLREILA